MSFHTRARKSAPCPVRPALHTQVRQKLYPYAGYDRTSEGSHRFELVKYTLKRILIFARRQAGRLQQEADTTHDGCMWQNFSLPNEAGPLRPPTPVRIRPFARLWLIRMHPA